MSAVNFLCSVCSKNINIDDEIVSTQCGHVFHVICLKQHHKEIPKCPQCLSEITHTTRLLLRFENAGPSKDHQIAELRSEIDHLYKTRNSLQHELGACKKELQNQQEECNKKTEEIKGKNKKLELLSLQIEDYARDASIKTIEIHKLKEALTSGNFQSLSTQYQEEIKVLKEKNKQISNELSKEIRNSSQLMTEKMRLESMLEHTKLLTQQTTDEAKTGENAIESAECVTETTPKNVSQNKCENTNSKNTSNEDFVQSVTIKNIRETFEDDEAIKKFVYRLSDLMGLYFTGDDIVNVKVLNRWEGKVSLAVKFKTLEMKSLFLSRKERVRQQEQYKNMFFYEYTDDATHILFQHAKSLRAFGYKHVYCRNNVVLVKKKSGSHAITINNRDDIEKLKVEVESQAAL